MKKIKIVLIGIMLLLVTGCAPSSKEVKSLDDFQDASSKENLIVSDNMASYSADYIKEAMIANGDNLAIEMIIYDNSDDASKVQEEQINAFMNRKSTSMVTKKLTGKNYYKYTMVTNGYYLVSSRVDNTLIFTNTPVENKEIVDKILETMGY